MAVLIAAIAMAIGPVSTPYQRQVRGSRPARRIAVAPAQSMTPLPTAGSQMLVCSAGSVSIAMHNATCGGV